MDKKAVIGTFSVGSRREGAERVNDEEAERSGMAELPAITPQRSEDVSASSRF